METLRKYFKLCLIAAVSLSFAAGNLSCKEQKCVANGGEAPKKVNKYRNKPQSGLWDKKMRRR